MPVDIHLNNDPDAVSQPVTLEGTRGDGDAGDPTPVGTETLESVDDGGTAMASGPGTAAASEGAGGTAAAPGSHAKDQKSTPTGYVTG